MSDELLLKALNNIDNLKKSLALEESNDVDNELLSEVYENGLALYLKLGRFLDTLKSVKN